MAVPSTGHMADGITVEGAEQANHLREKLLQIRFLGMVAALDLSYNQLGIQTNIYGLDSQVSGLG